MKIKIYIFIVLAAGLLAGSVSASPDTKSSASREYKIKAAFLYNFLKTVDWPKDALADSNEPIVIGLIGKDQFGSAFDPAKEKNVKGKKIIIKRFKGFGQRSDDKDETKSQAEVEALRKCHLLFVCSSEKAGFKEIIQAVRDHSVLTVGELDGFLEAGGIINFIPKAQKGEFEINVPASKHARLSISSKLIRIAKRVIKEEPSEKKEK